MGIPIYSNCKWLSYIWRRLFVSTAEPVAPPDLGVDKSQSHILVADNNKLVNSTIQANLTDAGYTVTSVTHHSEVLETIRTSQRPFNLVIVNIGAWTGTEVIDQIKDTYPKIKVLLVTGAGLDDAFRQDAILQKPFGNKQLLAAVKNLLK